MRASERKKAAFVAQARLPSRLRSRPKKEPGSGEFDREPRRSIHAVGALKASSRNDP
jgi:hypothetical protein